MKKASAFKLEQETILSIVLVVGGLLLILIHEAHAIPKTMFDVDIPADIISELGKEAGFAMLIAFFIKHINEKFLRRKIEATFEEERHKIAEDVLTNTFKKIIPAPVFAELHKTIFNGLKFIYSDFNFIYEFSHLPDGRLKIVNHKSYFVENVTGKDEIHLFTLGLAKEKDFDREFSSVFYSFDADPEVELKPACESVHRFGRHHDQYLESIKFPADKKRLLIKYSFTTVYTDSHKQGDIIKQFFLLPTTGVTVSIRKLPNDIETNISPFGGENFVDVPHPLGEVKKMQYQGCFYPYQGFVLTWEKAGK